VENRNTPIIASHGVSKRKTKQYILHIENYYAPRT